MIKKLTTIFLYLAIIANFSSFADEGMWLPLLLKKKEADMQKKGMKISAEDIYSVNTSSLKDAVMLFGRGCTGEFVSNEGLLLTNHHCGYGAIVEQSTVEHDYLTNGFWAMNKSEELPCPGLTITLLVYMEDVTNNVLDGISKNISETERKAIIEKNIKTICEKATKDNHYKAEIKPFYYGNQYFMYVNEVFKDIRLVGTPPSNIGKFGGDTDNWMWPRHTGDFSVFRVYADKDNKPADFSKNNVPYKPKKSLKINIKGANEGDFTFVFGYPGRTVQFLTSDAVDFIQNHEDPTRIKIRDARLKIYNDAMSQSPAQRLRYANNVAWLANGWKKWIGEVRGLKRLNAIEKKREFEKQFNIWANVTPERKDNYGNVLKAFENIYAEKKALEMPYIYFTEAVLGSDLMLNARSFNNLISKASKQNLSNDIIKADATVLMINLDKYFSNDYANHKIVDKKMFVETMTIFYNDICEKNYPEIISKVKSKFNSDSKKYFEYVYDNSFLSEKTKTEKALKKIDLKKLSSDPAIELIASISNPIMEKDLPKLKSFDSSIDSLYRMYVKGIMEMNSGKQFHPDANLTLRVAYGKVDGYKPRDGMTYNHYTTIEGIMEKENPDIYDYVVEKRLKELYNSKDYGRYKNSKGELPVAFIASNHTTGGNSGSPVMDANGDLIGINFDRNWEGTMSDVMYDPSQCRNISIDIRYCLFIIDKFAGAKNLIEEMTIVE